MVNLVRSRQSNVALCLIIGLIFALVMSTVSVFAVSEEQAMHNLTTYVYGNMSQEDYTLDEGGSIKGADLFEGSPTEGYELKEDQFQQLSSKAQTQVVNDIALYSNEAVEDDKVSGVEQSTVQTWWKQLQTKQGVGSKFMTEILQNTKPDFVAANQIWQPFAGPLGVLLGIIAVATMTLLGIVMAADIMYITIPPVRMMVGEDGEKGKLAKSKIFSHDALLAVRTVEEGDGEGKQALGIYLKRRIPALILLGICLVYLINGQLYTLVGFILDLLNGFLGF